MNTDMKWYAIVMIVIIGTPMAGLALKEYQNSQCRIEAMQKEAQQLLTNPAVQLAYEQFLLVCELTKKQVDNA